MSLAAASVEEERLFSKAARAARKLIGAEPWSVLFQAAMLGHAASCSVGALWVYVWVTRGFADVGLVNRECDTSSVAM